MKSRAFVTITGADDHVDPAALVRMREKYWPRGAWVEFAVLVSVGRAGTARYPSLSWISRIKKVRHVALHLCGEMSRRVLGGYGLRKELARNAIHCPAEDRVQLNGFSDFVLPDLAAAAGLEGPKLILQCKDFAALKRGGELAQRYPRIQLLWDPSGGTGTPSPIWPSGPPGITGYAGGIGPDNVLKVLDAIAALPHVGDFWIDMESGVRTDDEFDLEKVESVLKDVANWHIGR